MLPINLALRYNKYLASQCFHLLTGADEGFEPPYRKLHWNIFYRIICEWWIATLLATTNLVMQCEPEMSRAISITIMCLPSGNWNNLPCRESPPEEAELRLPLLTGLLCTTIAPDDARWSLQKIKEARWRRLASGLEPNKNCVWELFIGSWRSVDKFTHLRP